MDVTVLVLICFFAALSEVRSGVPPDVCFHQFKWEDCGMPPKPVIYYYKSGSRCEVGIWRGCQPNPNMFADEYECVQTCIFSMRAKPHEYHNLQDNLVEGGDVTKDVEVADAVTTEGSDSTLSNATNDEAGTIGDGSNDATAGGDTGAGDDAGTAAVEGTAAAGGEPAPEEAAPKEAAPEEAAPEEAVPEAERGGK